MLHQSVGRSVEGTTYIASVFVRADAPQTIVLSSNLSASVCDVSSNWTRCVTPPAEGNGQSILQLQIRTTIAGGSIDLYLWGAQVEASTAPTSPEIRSEPLWQSLLQLGINRFSFSSNTFQTSFLSRMRASAVAWDMFIDRPFTGWGLGSFPSEFSQRAPHLPPSQHAHNLVLQSLSETGILGLISWLLPLVYLSVSQWRRSWRTFLPILLCMTILNLGDQTYFYAGTYYPLWIGLGLVSNVGNYTLPESLENSAVTRRRNS